MKAWNRKIKRRSRRCFTLMELVAATGIMLAIAGIIAFASRSFYRALSSSEKVSARLQSYMNIDQVMDGCFRNMIPFNWEYDEDGYDDTYQVFAGDSDAIHFTTLRRSYDDVGGSLFFVRVYVDSHTDELVAEYSKFPRLPWLEDSDDMPYDREVLSPNVEQVTFLYAGVYNDQVLWLESWDRENYDFIPHAVQMTVEWKDGTTEQWLRRTAASGSNSVYGALNEVDE